MGNGVTKINNCFASPGAISQRHDIAVYLVDPLHDGLGHSFCYIRPERARLSTCKKIHSEETTTFRSISGASVSANTSTPPTDPYPNSNNSSGLDRASTFDCSDSFASIPLQPVPRGQLGSGTAVPGSGPIEQRGFLSGPIERGFLSGPIERGSYSGPVEREKERESGFIINEIEVKEPKKRSLMKTLKRAISKAISLSQKSIVTPIKGAVKETTSFSNRSSSGQIMSLSNDEVDEEDSEFSTKSQNLQWAQGKAGEDRVHIVISEENEWVFVGIYDGFNGPDAPDFLLSYLYANVHEQLKGLLRNDKKVEEPALKTEEAEESYVKRRKGKSLRYRSKKRLELDWRDRSSNNGLGVKHSDVFRALSESLRKTEEVYLELAEEKPELALMGSCVLVMLMKGEDVYLMNVGDSRAVLAQRTESDLGIGKGCQQDLEMISEEIICDDHLEVVNNSDNEEFYRLQNLSALQLTVDHSTYVDKEVQRIKKEHPDDSSAVINDRVKGYLKVTRAFGVGFLKQPKWNDILLEMFRIDYIGTSPYVTCCPSLYHHRLSPKDRFLILSSDGLYQYFTNEEAVSEVELFINAFPEGDPAQHLIEEVLFRAANKAGMDFHELLDIPQGDRRRYHDDVSVIIISFEGRIWRSAV